MNVKYLMTVLAVFQIFLACNDSNDYRDVYVGDYTGGYEGTIIIGSSGVTYGVDISGPITVSKDKSAEDKLIIEIADDTNPRSYSAFIDNGSLRIDAVEYDIANTDTRQYQVYESATGTITPYEIKLNFVYSGTATFEFNAEKPVLYEIGGSGTCYGTR